MNGSPIVITRAELPDLDALTPLFDGYRQFYEQASDLTLARDFLKERLSNRDSVVFIARCDDQATGFTQLYPSFSSTRAHRVFILNDLFVTPEARRGGVAERLLEAAADFAREVGALRLTLSTAKSNIPAQRLYDRLDWQRDDVFLTYNLAID